MKKGISLVALVITIIVLIILTVGVIMVASGENGIIERAKRATEENNERISTEKILLEVSNIKIEYVPQGRNVSQAIFNFETHENIQEMVNRLGERDITYIVDETNQIIEFTTDRYIVTTDYNGNIIDIRKGGTNSSNENDTISIGDYVYYNVPYSEVYTDYDFTAIDGWRYLGEDDDGDYLLVSTGIPILLDVNTGVNAAWWDDTQVDDSQKAMSGMMKNFEQIPYEQKASGTYWNDFDGDARVDSNTAVGLFGGTDGKIGQYFRDVNYALLIEEVRTLKVEEMNKALNQTIDIDENWVIPNNSLFKLNSLGKYGYENEAPSYCYRTTDNTYGQYSIGVFYGEDGRETWLYSESYYRIGVRPVIVISSTALFAPEKSGDEILYWRIR